MIVMVVLLFKKRLRRYHLCLIEYFVDNDFHFMLRVVAFPHAWRIRPQAIFRPGKRGIYRRPLKRHTVSHIVVAVSAWSTMVIKRVHKITTD